MSLVILLEGKKGGREEGRGTERTEGGKGKGREGGRKERMFHQQDSKGGTGLKKFLEMRVNFFNLIIPEFT